MKASETQPTAWEFGMRNPKLNILMRRWKGVLRNTRSMEDALLLLMQTPQTTPEQLAMAAKLYANVTQSLTDCAKAIDAYLYQGTKPEPKNLGCVFCGSTETPIEEGGDYPYCPTCLGT